MVLSNELHEFAEYYNGVIKKQNPYIYDMLSEEGKRMFMPKGVLSQAAEAKQKNVKYNATIGIAMENSEPMFLDSINNYFKDMSLKETFPYAPSTGIKELRELWKENIYKKNPSLKGKEISLPVTTIGLTHAVTITASLFLNADDVVLAPDMMWGNYKLILKERKKANLKTYKLFNDDFKLNIDNIRETFIKEAKANDKLFIIMNFPNNPSGYSPTIDEATEIAHIIKELPNYDCNIITIFDDAYFGLYYEDIVYKQSLFGEIACSSERILALKTDAATKEEYVWGFRVGFLTFGTKGNDLKALYEALENKASGVIRGTVSSPPNPLQQILLKGLKSHSFDSEKKQKSTIMKGRFLKVKETVVKEKYSDEWTPYPFNSGYFMCLKLKNVDAEKLREHLIDNYSLGVVSTNKTDIRVAFSCIEENSIEPVFDLIYEGIKDYRKKYQ